MKKLSVQRHLLKHQNLLTLKSDSQVFTYHPATGNENDAQTYKVQVDILI